MLVGCRTPVLGTTVGFFSTDLAGGGSVALGLRKKVVEQREKY